MVRDLLKIFETKDLKALSYINPKKYIQHNLAAEDGIKGLEGFISKIPAGSIKVNTVRLIADGDLVVAHSAYDSYAPMVGFDIFRFENGKIVEHWDNLAGRTPPNPSGRTQLDGETEIDDLEKTNENKKFVEKFVNTVLVQKRYEKVTSFIEPFNYKQHNSNIKDNLPGLRAAIESMMKQGIGLTYSKIHKVIGEGNFVLTVSEGKLGDKHVAYYDLFRLEKGMIVEHWDVIETILPKSQWKNQNGKF